MVKLNKPLGAGSQLFSLSLPGLSLWKYKSKEPSLLYLKGIQLLTSNRFNAFAIWKPSASYSVIDQKAFAGGALPLSKCNVYLFVPSRGFPLSSAKLMG